MYKHFRTYERSILASTFKPRERSSRQHNCQLHTPKSNDGKRGPQTNSFYHRVVKVWNNLPERVVHAETINSFKNSLDEYWKDDPIQYDYQYEQVAEHNEG